MAEIYANGDQIISSGELIYDLANDYLKQINTLFNSLSKLEQTAWSGNSASTYVAKLATDKRRFVEFGEYLKMYGKVIKNTGTNVNRIITKWEDK